MTLTIINCIHVPSLTQLVVFKSQPAIVSKIPIVLAFFQVKAYVSKIELAAK